MNRRTFLVSLGAVGAGAALVPELHAAEAPTAPKAEGGNDVFAFPPYAQLTAPGTLDIRWRTKRPATAFVYWTQDPASPREQWARACRTEDGMIAANETSHCVTLRGLDPAKPVCFEAVSEPIRSFGAYSIKREAAAAGGKRTLRPTLGEAGSLTATVFNDLHGKVELIQKLLAVPTVAEAKPAFAVFNGDCVDDCGDQAGVERRFLRALPPLNEAGLAALFLRGNHEYRGAMARRIRNNLSPLACGRYYGAFTLGPVRFLCIDSGEDKPDDSPVYGGLLATDAYIEEQAAWLAREIETPEHKAARWRVALLHIPPTCGNIGDNDKWYGPTRLRERLDPLFAKAGLTAMLCAHTHVYSFHPPAKTGRPYPIMIGGGPSEKAATVMLLRADATRFDLTAYRADGSALDSVKA